MGRPKKEDCSSWRSSRPGKAVDKKTTKQQCHDNAVLGQGAVGGGMEEGEKDSASQDIADELQSKFSLEAVYESSFNADEFLEAVGIGLGHSEPSVKSEPSGMSAESTMEQTQITTALASSSISTFSSSLSPWVSSRSASCGSGGLDRPVPISPAAEDGCLLQLCPDPTLSPTLSSSGVSVNQVQVNTSLPHHSSASEVARWMGEEEAVSSSDSVASADFPDRGHSECYDLWSPSLDSSVGDSTLSPPCFCDPCSCSSPISDCDSPRCSADYRSQMHYLSSFFTSQQIPASSGPQVSPASADTHDRYIGAGKPSFLPSVPPLRCDQLTTAYPTFLPPCSHTFLRQQTTPQTEEARQISAIPQLRAPPANPPCCHLMPPDGRGILRAVPGSSCKHQRNDSGALKPDHKLTEKQMEDKTAAELKKLFNSVLERPSMAGKASQHANICMTASSSDWYQQHLHHADASRLLHNQGIHTGNTSQESRRRQSDSQLDYVPGRKFIKLDHHVNSTGDCYYRAVPGSGPVPADIRSGAFAGRHWSRTSNGPSTPQLLTPHAPFLQQQCEGSAGSRMSRSLSHSSLHPAGREVRSAAIMPAGGTAVSQFSFNPNRPGIQYGASHHPLLVKQGRQEHGVGMTREVYDKLTTLPSAAVATRAARKAQNPKEDRLCGQSAVSSSCEGLAALNAFSMAISSLDPFASVLRFSPKSDPQVSYPKTLSTMATWSGNSSDVIMTNTTVGCGANNAAVHIQGTSSNTPSESSTVTTNITSLRPTKLTSNACKPPSTQEDFSLSLSSSGWPPSLPGPAVGRTSAACPPMASLPSPLAAEGAPATAFLSCPATCEEASSARIAPATPGPGTARPPTAVSWNLRALEEVNRYFLTLENTCEKTGCGKGLLPGTPTATDLCQSLGCPVCHPSQRQPGCGESHAGGAVGVHPGLCLKRWHRYWHGYRPAPSSAHVTSPVQQYLACVVSAFSQLRDDLAQLHQALVMEREKEEQTANLSEVLLRLHQQGVSIAAMSRRFLLALPGAHAILSEDADLLSRHFGFSASLILLSVLGFDPECRRFREVLVWSVVGPECPLFSFRARLLAVGSSLHALAMDKVEAALLCALSVCSTDLSGLRDSRAVQAVLTTTLGGLQSHLSTRDQDPWTRVQRLFSVLPDVRLISAWFTALLSHLQPQAPSPQTL